MKMALFLDVDGVITDRPINAAIAGELGVLQDLLPLEQRLREDKITSAEFGGALCRLFADRGLTPDWVDRNWQKMPLRAQFRGELQTRIPTYLVSQGPSYFVEALARRMGISRDRCLYSTYEFDDQNRLAHCARPVTAAMKGDFVREFVRDYDFTIGVGDQINLDTQFLSQCDLQLLLTEGNAGRLADPQTEEIVRQQGFLRVSNIEATLGLIQRLVRVRHRIAVPSEALRLAVARFVEQYDGPNVFIITPFADDPLLTTTIRAVKEELRAHGITGMTAMDAQTRDDLWDNVRTFLHGCDAAIAVLVPERRIRPRGSKSVVHGTSISPNVAMEIGYMLCMNRPVLLLKDRSIEGLPVNIGSRLYREFNPADGGRGARGAVKKWVTELALGRRGALSKTS